MCIIKSSFINLGSILDWKAISTVLFVLISLFNGGQNLEISFGVREGNLEESEVKRRTDLCILEVEN